MGILTHACCVYPIYYERSAVRCGNTKHLIIVFTLKALKEVLLDMGTLNM